MFGNNVKYLLDDMFSNYQIIIDKWEQHGDYVRHIFRDILSGPNSTFNSFIERTKDYCYTIREVPEVKLIQNTNEKYNNTAAEK